MTLLETIVDNLRDGYAQLEPGTFSHADQFMAAQVQDASLRNRWFYVADGPLYSLEGKKRTPTLWLTREPDNLVLRYLKDEVNSSYNQLLKTGDFRPDPKEAQQVMKAKDTLRIDLTKLRLKGNEREWRYLEISTTDYDSLNKEERKLAERFYGAGGAFGTAMKTLNDAAISVTKVYVLNPAYVSKEAKKGPIGRAAWRGGFYLDASSYAGNRYVGDHGGLLGVRQVVAPQGRAASEGVPGAVQEMVRVPTMEEVVAYSTRFIPEACREDFATGLQKLYKP